MTYDPERHHRRSVRLRGYDYARNGAYFVTICTHERQGLFGEISNGEMRLNDAGRLIEELWEKQAEEYPEVVIDALVVMPNHLHAIVVFGSDAKKTGVRGEGVMNHAPTLGKMVRAFKARATAALHRGCVDSVQPVWQRNYYEHIIRKEDSLLPYGSISPTTRCGGCTTRRIRRGISE